MNAVAAAGLVIIAVVTGTGLLAGQGLARHWAAPAAILPAGSHGTELPG